MKITYHGLKIIISLLVWLVHMLQKNNGEKKLRIYIFHNTLKYTQMKYKTWYMTHGNISLELYNEDKNILIFLFVRKGSK